MPGRSSGQDKEAVVQGPERRTLGEASLRLRPALGAFIACAAWGGYAKRHVGGSGPEGWASAAPASAWPPCRAGEECKPCPRFKM